MTWHPSSTFVRVGGRRIHVVEAGDAAAPAVVLLHGFMHSAWTWRWNVDALAEDHRVLAVDLPGLGASEDGAFDYSFDGLAGFVTDLLDALGIARARALVGSSLGGAAAVTVALDAPDRVDRLVLSCPMGLRFGIPPAAERLRRRALDPLFRVVATRRTLLRRFLVTTAYRRVAVDDEVLRGFLPNLRKRGALALTLDQASPWRAATSALSPRLSEVAKPTLIVWGRHDRLIPSDRAARYQARVPGSRLVMFEDCAHCPHEEHPARFNALVRGFLAEPGEQTTRPRASTERRRTR